MNIEHQLLDALLDPVRHCRKHLPRVHLADGRRIESCSYNDYRKIHHIDPLARCFGIDSERMYIALRLASVNGELYKSWRNGFTRLFRAIIQKQAGYKTKRESNWSYSISTRIGTLRSMSFDACLRLKQIQNPRIRNNVEGWLVGYCQRNEGVMMPEKGIVFTIDLGFGAEGRKKAYADLDHGSAAWSRGYFPVYVLLSSRYHDEGLSRYFNTGWGALSASLHNDVYQSLFAFSHHVLEFDLAAFLDTNAPKIQSEFDAVLKSLIEVSDKPVKEPAGALPGSGGGSADEG